MNNNKRPSFILPKMQKVQKNDLISILSLQPKNISELQQYRLSDFNTNSNIVTKTSTNNGSNNDFFKSAC